MPRNWLKQNKFWAIQKFVRCKLSNFILKSLSSLIQIIDNFIFIEIREQGEVHLWRVSIANNYVK